VYRPLQSVDLYPGKPLARGERFGSWRLPESAQSDVARDADAPLHEVAYFQN